MADRRLIIEITVKDETSQASTKTESVDDKVQEKGSSLEGYNDLVGTGKLQNDPTYQKGVKAGQLAVTALKAAENMVINEVNFEMNYMFQVTDNYIGQRNMGVAKQYISAASEALSTIGTMTASFGWAGALVGTAIVVGNTAISNYQSQKEEDLAVRKMEAQLNFTRKRAGYAEIAASIGEDL